MASEMLCSECFTNEGLRIGASIIGKDDNGTCQNCGSDEGKKLPKDLVMWLVQQFFVFGSHKKCDYGGAPLVQFNNMAGTDIDPGPDLVDDVRLLEKFLKIGFFHYGPRLWMLGEVEPLKDLADENKRATIIDRIVNEYPERIMQKGTKFYRIRKSVEPLCVPEKYDSPPSKMRGRGRLDEKNFPVLYASEDLQICMHECRVTVEDECYMATLKSRKNIRLLDLTVVLDEEDSVTEFESLDIAVNMLFMAGKHSYAISRAIARAAKEKGFEGLIFPSYYSFFRSGAAPLETVYGISYRKIEQMKMHEESKFYPNLAIFGEPIKENVVEVSCMNRIHLARAEYIFNFGPVGL